MNECANERECEPDQREATPGLLPLILPPPAAACAISVVIPARNEADSILATLTAVANQRTLDGRPLPRSTYDVILLANNCQDGTAQVARSLAARTPGFALHVAEVGLPRAVAHVGFARRLAMDEASRRFAALRHPWGVIATTDADTVVAPTWLAATLRAVEQGAEAVGGRIQMDHSERRAMTPAVRRRYLYDAGYQALVNAVTARLDPRPHDPWPNHHQFLGASIALTASAYRRVGGLPAVPSSEDVALARALRRADIGIRHSPDVRVSTSGRLHGRAPGGMAATLAAWSSEDSAGSRHVVPSVAAIETQATARRTLRDQWRRVQAGGTTSGGVVEHLAEAAGVSAPWLREAIQAHRRFGTLLEAVEHAATWPGCDALVDVHVAIAGLRAWLADDRRWDALHRTFRGHYGQEPLVLFERTHASTSPATALPLGTVLPLPLAGVADAEPEVA